MPVVGHPCGCGGALGACPVGVPRLGDTLNSEPGRCFLGLHGTGDSWHAVPILSDHAHGLQRRLDVLTTSYGAFIHPMLSTLHLLTEMGSGAHLTVSLPLLCPRHPSHLLPREVFLSPPIVIGEKVSSNSRSPADFVLCPKPTFRSHES